MNRALLAVLGLAVVLALAPSAAAQTDTSRRVSIDVTAVPPQYVFDLLAKALKCRFIVDPAVNRPLTLRVVDTPVQLWNQRILRHSALADELEQAQRQADQGPGQERQAQAFPAPRRSQHKLPQSGA